ncbi:NAD(P)/FAD-dependent oxidoreductase [Sulfobacillus thermosulfidooxidans]|uniref:NAD(P)/FAD-dependent oxidoreductase n=1 Tax=Sulfobacillus thermosulfidooxidans TaxID=28034 RepID=UPI0006B6953C|nr:FAD-dependent oxidoreductase [Sulfobacillus thermosulfidooxidans]
MKRYDYLIVGGGVAAASAVAGIRRRDKSGSIGLFSEERYPVYNRPPLSKKLWMGERIEDIWMRPSPLTLNAQEHLTTKITAIDRQNKIVMDEFGNSYGYGKLLLATGGTPAHLPSHDVPIIYFRSLDDYFSLRRVADEKNRFLVIGGGFIGSEIAAALNLNEKEVTMVFPEPHLVDRFFPEDLKHVIDQEYLKRGVKLIAGDRVTHLAEENGEIMVTTKNGISFSVEAVVAGIGITPNTDLAKMAGLTVNDGIVVNEYLQTSDPDIYSAGDVTSFPYPYPDQKSRVEHEDNALTQGRAAGENMAGANKPYTHLPFFYSDMFSLGYEAIGRLDGNLEIFADWVKFGEEGVLYYLHDQRVVGILNWNVWDGIPKAREIIEEQRVYNDPSVLKGAIRNA